MKALRLETVKEINPIHSGAAFQIHSPDVGADFFLINVDSFRMDYVEKKNNKNGSVCSKIAITMLKQ